MSVPMPLEGTAKWCILYLVWLNGSVTQTTIWKDSFFLLFYLTFKLWSEDRVTHFLVVSPAVLKSISLKFQFRQNSCSDTILQYLLELCQQVSQVLTAEWLDSGIWDLAPFSSKWKCMCFMLAGSIQVVCIALFGFPAICSSPFASPVLTTLSVCSTVLGTFPTSWLPFVAPFLFYLG